MRVGVLGNDLAVALRAPSGFVEHEHLPMAWLGMRCHASPLHEREFVGAMRSNRTSVSH